MLAVLEESFLGGIGIYLQCVVMRLTAPSALNGDCGAMVVNMVAGSVFGEDALEKASVEEQVNAKLNGRRNCSLAVGDSKGKEKVTEY
ncbi:hypothetical protein F0562_034155 [Nyssa sinensis]|uniref:Uncharacterized protein n=1 Tax=Nyssa sinensis TaxID=561372 RepID=A0A5J5AF90_9ASTE|nr:hypothetical protein F0562_034155 [Nyssa sinensis]